MADVVFGLVLVSLIVAGWLALAAPPPGQPLSKSQFLVFAVGSIALGVAGKIATANVLVDYLCWTLIAGGVVGLARTLFNRLD